MRVPLFDLWCATRCLAWKNNVLTSHCCNLLRWLRHILSHHLYDSILSCQTSVYAPPLACQKWPKVTGSVQSSCHRHLLICRKFWRFFSDPGLPSQALQHRPAGTRRSQISISARSLQDLAVSQASFLRGSDHHSNAILHRP